MTYKPLKMGIGTTIAYGVGELVRAVIGAQEPVTPQQAYQAFIQPTKTVEQTVQPQENGLVAKLRGFVGSEAFAGESYNHLIEPYKADIAKISNPRTKTITRGNDEIILKRFKLGDVKITSFSYSDTKEPYGYMIMDPTKDKNIFLKDSTCDGVLNEIGFGDLDMSVPKCKK